MRLAPLFFLVLVLATAQLRGGDNPAALPVPRNDPVLQATLKFISDPSLFNPLNPDTASTERFLTETFERPEDRERAEAYIRDAVAHSTAALSNALDQEVQQSDSAESARQSQFESARVARESAIRGLRPLDRMRDAARIYQQDSAKMIREAAGGLKIEGNDDRQTLIQTGGILSEKAEPKQAPPQEAPVEEEDADESPSDSTSEAPLSAVDQLEADERQQVRDLAARLSGKSSKAPEQDHALEQAEQEVANEETQDPSEDNDDASKAQNVYAAAKENASNDPKKEAPEVQHFYAAKDFAGAENVRPRENARARERHSYTSVEERSLDEATMLVEEVATTASSSAASSVETTTNSPSKRPAMKPFKFEMK